MSSRETILAAVREKRPEGEFPLPDVPIFAFDDGGDQVACFLRRLQDMGGQGHMGKGSLAEWMHRHFAQARVVASTIPACPGNRDLAAVARPADLADVDVAVVRGVFGVAETGSVLLDDTHLACNAVAYLAQHLVIVLNVADIVPSLQEAYRRPEMSARPYACFHSGPSATADIEGVLIRGAQGVRSLTVWLERTEAKP